MATLATVLIACGGGPQTRPFALDDPRLPTDARRWIADAEDAVVVARARLATAEVDLESVRAWQRAMGSAPPLTGSSASTTTARRDGLALARIAHAKSMAAETSQFLTLARERLVLAYAETAMRHDIAVYDLLPLQTQVKVHQALYLEARTRSRAAQQTAVEATDAWWKAWRAYVAAKNDATPFWMIRQ
jgi:hypothetical protein